MSGATIAVSWSGYIVNFIETITKYNTTKSIVEAPVAWSEDSYSIYATGRIINLPAAILIIALTILLLFDIGKSATINLIVVIIKIIVILLFIFANCVYVQRSNYIPFFPPNEGKRIN